MVAGDNTVRYKNRSLQIPADATAITTSRRVRVHEYPEAIWRSSTDPGACARYTAEGELRKTQTRAA